MVSGQVGFRAGIVVSIVFAFGVIASRTAGHAPAPDEPPCSSGAHTLSHFGDHVYPEMGNGGYTSVHTDVNLVYDAVEQRISSPGNNVVLDPGRDRNA